MSGWIKDIVNDMINGVLNTITAATLASLDWVLKLLTDSIFHSPDLTSLPQVAYISGRAQLTANACMTLIVAIVGLIAMTHGTVQERHSLKELLPRMLLGFAMANMANPIIRAVVTGANAVTVALAGGDFTSQDSFNMIKRTIVDATGDPAQFILELVLKEIAMWMLVFVVITWLGRMSVLLIVAATGPIALMCHAISFAEPVAKLWWRALLSCLAVQILQAVTLHLAVGTMLVPGGPMPTLGLPSDPTGLFNTLVACFLLWMVIRIPKWVTRNIGGTTTTSRGRSMLGSIVRLIIVQQVLGAAGLRGGARKVLGRRAGGRAAGAPGMRPPGPHAPAHAGSHRPVHPRPPGNPPRTTAAPGSTQPRPYQTRPVPPSAWAKAGRPPRPAGGSRRAPKPPDSKGNDHG